MALAYDLCHRGSIPASIASGCVSDSWKISTFWPPVLTCFICFAHATNLYLYNITFIGSSLRRTGTLSCRCQFSLRDSKADRGTLDCIAHSLLYSGICFTSVSSGQLAALVRTIISSVVCVPIGISAEMPIKKDLSLKATAVTMIHLHIRCETEAPVHSSKTPEMPNFVGNIMFTYCMCIHTCIYICVCVSTPVPKVLSRKGRYLGPWFCY